MFAQVPTLPPLPEQVIVQSLPPWWMTLPPQVTGVIAIGFLAAVAVVLHPLMRAIGRRIEGRQSTPDPALRAEVDQLQARLHELEQVQHRVMELEERVDFAERLLAQRREPDRIDRGQS